MLIKASDPQIYATAIATSSVVMTRLFQPLRDRSGYFSSWKHASSGNDAVSESWNDFRGGFSSNLKWLAEVPSFMI
jgi:hypothetical protein